MQHVLAMGACFQVSRVDASANIAQMHDIETVGNGPEGELVSDPVRSPYAASKSHCSILEGERALPEQASRLPFDRSGEQVFERSRRRHPGKRDL